MSDHPDLSHEGSGGLQILPPVPEPDSDSDSDAPLEPYLDDISHSAPLFSQNVSAQQAPVQQADATEDERGGHDGHEPSDPSSQPGQSVSQRVSRRISCPSPPAWLFDASLFVCLILVRGLAAAEFGANSLLNGTISGQFKSGELLPYFQQAHLFGQIITKPWAGRLCRLFPMWQLMLASLLVYILALFLGSYAPGPIYFLAARVVIGMAYGFIFVMVDILLQSDPPVPKRMHHASMMVGDSARIGFDALGAWLGGIVSDEYGWRFVYRGCALVASLLLIIVVLMKRRALNEGNAQRMEMELGFWTKLGRVDWYGSLILVIAVGGAMLGLNGAGMRFSFGSPYFYVPLTVSGLFLAGFIWWIRKWTGQGVRRKSECEPILDWNLLVHQLGFWHVCYNLASLADSLFTNYVPTYFKASQHTDQETGRYISPSSAVGVSGILLAGGVETYFVTYHDDSKAWVVRWLIVVLGLATASILAFGICMGTLTDFSKSPEWVMYFYMGLRFGLEAAENAATAVLRRMVEGEGPQLKAAMSAKSTVQSVCRTTGLSAIGLVFQQINRAKLIEKTGASKTEADSILQDLKWSDIKAKHPEWVSGIEASYQQSLDIIYYIAAGCGGGAMVTSLVLWFKVPGLLQSLLRLPRVEPRSLLGPRR